MATDKQRRMAWAKANACFPDDPKGSIEALCKELGIPTHSQEQTAKQASALIERLAELEQQMAGNDAGQGY